MSPAEEMAAAQAGYGRQGPQCLVCCWLEAREDRKDWDGPIRTFGPKAAFTVLKRHGFEGSISTVKRHKRERA